ncbi:unnamed protein product [Linum tenue]|uniref:Pectin acetylesterase n=1 Tax=Linum tenue TaxID=586396 RepID=A0AAV0H9Q9_9ROSI|nr:unnamed protein product [Linum tenue]
MSRRSKVLMIWVWAVVVGIPAANGCFPGEQAYEEAEEAALVYTNATAVYSSKFHGNESKAVYSPLMVGLTLIHAAAAEGAVCLDGTLPGYHLHRGYGSGANSWLIQLEGGGWCNSIRTCVYRKTTRRGSSRYMEKHLAFTGILSNRAELNPDFFNWNRVKVRYCDGASFLGDSENKAARLQFRGQRIWVAAMRDLLSKGMRNAHQALLSGCSAGGLAAILHCDEFRELFPRTTKVKCLSDAGLFLDSQTRRSWVPYSPELVQWCSEVAGGGKESASSVHQPSESNSANCGNWPPFLLHQCFFPQHIIATVKTPLFLLNAAYDSWQIQSSLAPPSADPRGYWNGCRKNNAKCTPSQIKFLQGFRYRMLRTVRRFSMSKANGMFINSCFAHCQTERQDTWFADYSPAIRNKVTDDS